MALENDAARAGIEDRAATGTLTAEDYRTLRHARAVRDGLREQKSIARIAEELGDISRSALSRFRESARYADALRVLDGPTAAAKKDAIDEDTAVAAARLALAGRLKDAVEFLDHCFRRDEEKPGRPYLDDGLAQWGTQLAFKAAGMLDGPKNGAANAGALVVTAEAMRVMLGAVHRDDKIREAKDVTPVVAQLVDARAVPQ